MGADTKTMTPIEVIRAEYANGWMPAFVLIDGKLTEVIELRGSLCAADGGGHAALYVGQFQVVCWKPRLNVDRILVTECTKKRSARAAASPGNYSGAGATAKSA
jgi:hypothetical protein